MNKYINMYIQASKKGIMEAADMVVVNKADGKYFTMYFHMHVYVYILVYT
jgi:putative protein kinase ArgK-like GTPase of G3E family